MATPPRRQHPSLRTSHVPGLPGRQPRMRVSVRGMELLNEIYFSEAFHCTPGEWRQLMSDLRVKHLPIGSTWFYNLLWVEIAMTVATAPDGPDLPLPPGFWSGKEMHGIAEVLSISRVHYEKLTNAKVSKMLDRHREETAAIRKTMDYLQGHDT